jgi:CSLREA domain-containing protein
VRRSAVAAWMGAVCALLLAPGYAGAESFVVNSLGDGSPNGCTTDPQGCTLEEAITAANGNGDSVIDQISFSVTGTILLASGLPSISTQTTITGPSPAELQVAGNAISPVSGIFGVTVPLGQTVRIEKIKIASARAFGFFGGGVGMLGAGTLELDSVWFFDNSASSGGAVGYTAGTTTITNSLFSNNRADAPGTDGVAGAIAGSGPGHANVINSTFTNNAAKQFGGAIHIGTSATLTVNSSTIFGNTANSDNNMSGDGGGIVRNASAGTLLIANTLLAGNSVGPGAGTAGQCSGAFTSQGFNLRSAADLLCTGFTATGDFVNANPLLGTLGENDGLTLTIPLLTGSPAINAGNPAPLGAFPACPATDQRGRPRGGGAGNCDIGALERLGHATTTTVTCTPASLNLGAGSTACNVTVADTSSMPTNPMGNVSFTSSGSGTFSGGGSCLLLGNAGAPGCQVTYTPTTAGSGSHRITASYPGDVDHDPSQGAAQLAVVGPAGTVPITPVTPPKSPAKAIKKCKKKFPKGPKRKKCIKRAKKLAQV